MESGKKIIGYVDFFTVLGIIVVAIASIVVFVLGVRENNSLLAFLAIVGALIGVMWLLLQKWLLYGFADLVHNSNVIRKKLCATEEPKEEKAE